MSPDRVMHTDDDRTASQIIRVHVGPRNVVITTFNIHSHILAAAPYFAAILDSENFEMIGKIDFDGDPTIFGLMVEYLYTGSIRSEDDKAPTMEQYFRVWLLGDFLKFIELQNYCAWCLIEGYDAGNTIPPARFSQLYDASRKAAKSKYKPMVTFIVDMIVWGDIAFDPFKLKKPSLGLLMNVVVGLQEKAAGDFQNPFLDIANWYVGDEEIKSVGSSRSRGESRSGSESTAEGVESVSEEVKPEYEEPQEASG